MTDRRIIWVGHQARQRLLPFARRPVAWPPNWLRQPAWFGLRRDEILRGRVLPARNGIWTVVLTGTRPSGLRYGRAYFVELESETEAQRWLSELKLASGQRL